jgi:hypothetical protein
LETKKRLWPAVLRMGRFATLSGVSEGPKCKKEGNHILVLKVSAQEPRFGYAPNTLTTPQPLDNLDVRIVGVVCATLKLWS